MAKFRITYGLGGPEEPEEIEADRYDDQGKWIDFYSEGQRTLRVFAEHVRRIEMTSEPEPYVPGIA
jgi:hypothetical protein